MKNITYTDDSVVYQSETGKVLFHGRALPATGELMKRAREQLESSSQLFNWKALPNDDLNKSILLYAMLDGKLFYDLLCNQDKIEFALELYHMGQDTKNFDEQNRNYFEQFANAMVKNAQNAQVFIDDEDDIILSTVLEEYLQYNSHLFQSNMGITR